MYRTYTCLELISLFQGAWYGPPKAQLQLVVPLRKEKVNRALNDMKAH